MRRTSKADCSLSPPPSEIGSLSFIWAPGLPAKDCFVPASLTGRYSRVSKSAPGKGWRSDTMEGTWVPSTMGAPVSPGSRMKYSQHLGPSRASSSYQRESPGLPS
ncbi:uncharacterized protein WM277_021479 isoform 1-T1 [Molossus nigricans]